MKEVSLLLLIALKLGSPCKAQSWPWSVPVNNLDYIQTAIAENDDIYVTGTFEDSCTIAGTHLYSDSVFNAVLAKFSPEGLLAWTKVFSGSTAQFVNLRLQQHDAFLGFNLKGSMSGAAGLSSPSGSFCLLKIFNNGSAGVPSFPTNSGVYDFDLAADGALMLAGVYQDSLIVGDTTFPGGPTSYVATMDADNTVTLFQTIKGPDPSPNILSATRDNDGNLYINGAFGNSLYVGDDTLIDFHDSPFSNLLILDAQGEVVGSHPSNLYFPHLQDFYPLESGNTVELWEDFGCNHCNAGLFIRKTDPNGALLWNHQYAGSNIYDLDQFGMGASGLTVSENTIYYAAHYLGSYNLDAFSIDSSGKYLAKMDDEGNYLAVESIPDSIDIGRLSNFRNGAFIASARYTYHPQGYISKYQDYYPASINEPSTFSKFTLYPNPATGIIHFDIPQEKLGSVLEILDNSGRSVAQVHPENNNADLSFLPNGMYVAKLRFEDFERYCKFVICK
jgi:hypothetical protein